MTNKEILDLIDRLFAGVARPEHFTDYKHCDECKAHDVLLRSRSVDSLMLDDIDSNWNPVVFMTAEAMLYYFPALVRLSISSDKDCTYLDRLIFHLRDKDQSQFKLFSNDQICSVIKLLEHIKNNYIDVIEYYGIDTNLDEIIEAWKLKIKTNIWDI